MTAKKKVAIVTGNFQGLGREISLYLEANSYYEPKIIRSNDYNLAKHQECAVLVREIIARHGKLDLLVNNVGNYINAPISDFSLEDWHEMFNTNLHASFYMTSLCLPYLRKSQGQIINVAYAGMAKLSPGINTAAYQAAKTALLVYGNGIAKAEAVNKVRVNTLSPAYLENTVIDEYMPEIPLGRFAKMSEAIAAFELLLTNEYMTGHNLELTGGFGI